MNGLSLFTGGAIGELVFKEIFPDYKTVGYVEWDVRCQELIQQRIKDGILDDAPIFGDIRQFNERYASLYTGKVDWLSGGFPCQPFSNAGRKAGEADERNMWPATRDAIRIIRPKQFLLENVPNLLTFPYIWRILSDLAEIGYEFEWDVVSARYAGQPIIRRRFWLLGEHIERNRENIRVQKRKRIEPERESANTQGEYCMSNVESSWLVANGLGVGVRDGLAKRMERQGHIIGNGWCPQTVARILEVYEK